MPIQKENNKENEAPLGPEARPEENGEEVFPSSSDSWVLESVVSSPSGVRGALSENGFIVI